MPRQNRRRSLGSPPRTPGTASRTESWGDRDWTVRLLAGAAASKTYRCPGCDHEIRPASPHVVVWPADVPDGPDTRRHWHTACWRARDVRRLRPVRPARRPGR